MKTNNISSSLLVTFCTIWITACSNQPTLFTHLQPAIYGRVVDSAGSPLADAAIGLLFSFRTVSEPGNTDSVAMLIFPNPCTELAEVSLVINAPGNIILTLLNEQTGSLIQTLINSSLTPGSYTVQEDLSDLPNQSYLFHLEANGVVGERRCILNTPATSDIVPLLRTDSSGRFAIPYNVLPIGKTFPRTFDNGQMAGWMAISDSLGLIIEDQGVSKRSATWWLRVDTTVTIDSTIQIR